MDIVGLRSGDYVTYYDFHGNKRGVGIFIKYVEDFKFPLTRKKMLLKNFKTNAYWTIYVISYKIEFKKHVSISEKRIGDIICFLNENDV